MGYQTLMGFGSREELEWNIVSSICERPELLTEIGLRPEHFSTKASVILENIASLYSSGEAVDAITVANKIRPLGLLGTWALKYNPLCIPAMTPTYAKILKDIAKGETLDVEAKKSIETKETGNKLEIFRSAVLDSNLPIGRRENMKSLLTSGFNRLEKIRDHGGLIGLPTGFSKLDVLLGGWHPQLVVIAGRPSMGKSSFTLTTAIHVAKEGCGVFYLTGESSIEAISARAFSIFSGVPLYQLQNGTFPKEDWEKIIGALKFSDLNFTVEEKSSRTIEELCIVIRQAHAQNKFDLLVIDHLQTLRSSNKNKSYNRHQEISLITQVLKDISTSLKIPVILTSQLNREIEKTKESRPTMSALKESGDIEQIADVVGLLYRPNYYDQEKDVSLADLGIAKNRDGKTGTIELTWDGDHATFKDREDKWNI